MNLLYFTILLPLISFLLLSFSLNRYSNKLSSVIGIGSIGLTALLTIYIVIDFFIKQSSRTSIIIYQQNFWNWISVDNLNVKISLMLDGLSLTMLSIIIGVSFLIHIFSYWYMCGEEGYSRFFAYTNLFVAGMIILVLAKNFLLMYLGWEIVGLCSYLLIGFYYKIPSNGIAAIKAFLITRIGDIFLIFSLFIFYKELGSLDIPEIITLAHKNLEVSNITITIATLMLLIGAIGKSAQLPLQTWLVEAMVGPTPVSALIHAATMVTAGVYLIARTHSLFLMAPEILHIVAIVGTMTLLLAGFSALTQNNIKRILAYSTMSQIGYMFLALGAQAWNAAIFHLMTHAFFKALLFLSSGSIILACHHEQNIFKMGGLKKSMPLIYICFLIGGSSLSAFPLLTAGFFSKEAILSGTMIHGHLSFTIFAILGEFITSLYTFRMIFIMFYGQEKIKVSTKKNITHHLPLYILLFLSTFVGAMIIPPLKNIFPKIIKLVNYEMLQINIASSLVTIIGIVLAKILWIGKKNIVNKIINNIDNFIKQWWFYDFGFDWLYNKIFVLPYLLITKLLKNDPLNYLINVPVFLFFWSNRNLAICQNGKIRWYIASIEVGTVFILGLLLFY
ncbi:NADH-quinone oxidoreductase subunit L [Candidatus Ecksteinia adelgidicola]|nr:NADH-quinone oxidoreductase subunit L [Candidatus Ecksteinia adelgidicola]